MRCANDGWSAPGLDGRSPRRVCCPWGFAPEKREGLAADGVLVGGSGATRHEIPSDPPAFTLLALASCLLQGTVRLCPGSSPPQLGAAQGSARQSQGRLPNSRSEDSTYKQWLLPMVAVLWRNLRDDSSQDCASSAVAALAVHELG